MIKASVIGAGWYAADSHIPTLAAQPGVVLDGVCIDPVPDYAGWDNARHCPCGPIGVEHGRRFVRAGHGDAIARLASAARGFAPQHWPGAATPCELR